jgi:hypothetical protein
MGDVDGDGAVDLLVTTVGGPARLFKNVAPKQGHWLAVRLVGKQKRDAYGAEVKVQAGGKRWLGLLCPGQSYLASHEPVVHFGLGDAQRLDTIDVLWPDGQAERFPGQPADQRIVLRQGEGAKP